MIPATGPFDSALVRETFGLGASFTSAQLATAAGLSAAFTSNQLRGRSGSVATSITILTNDPSASAFTRHQVTGYSGNRSIRVERYAYSGDAFSQLEVKVYTSTTKDGTYTLRGTILPQNAGMAIVDFTLATNSWIKYEVVAATGGGKKTGKFEMVIWDLTAGARLSTGKWVNVTVDADNNYVQQYKIDHSVQQTFVRDDGWNQSYVDTVSCSLNRGSNPAPTAYRWYADSGLYARTTLTSANATFEGNEYEDGRQSSQQAYVYCEITVGGVKQIVSKLVDYYG